MTKKNVENAIRGMVERAAYQCEHGWLSGLELDNTMENAAPMYTALLDDNLEKADKEIKNWAMNGAEKAKAEKEKAARDFYKWGAAR